MGPPSHHNHAIDSNDIFMYYYCFGLLVGGCIRVSGEYLWGDGGVVLGVVCSVVCVEVCGEEGEEGGEEGVMGCELRGFVFFIRFFFFSSAFFFFFFLFFSLSHFSSNSSLDFL